MAHVVPSLAIVVQQNPDGTYTAEASWTNGPLEGDTWEEVYFACMRILALALRSPEP